MSSPGDCLGICFANRQLFYAVNHPSKPESLTHIGCIDFNFSIADALINPDGEAFSGLSSSLSSLSGQYNCPTLRMLSPSRFECWSTFPRLVYETPDEREDHLSILMNGVPRNELEATWHELSNRDFRLLMVRNRNLSEQYRTLAATFSQTDFVSEFELGMEWHQHTGMKGSYLTVHAHQGGLCLASYLLGKLRGATHIRYEDLNDLPFLWNYHARQLNWMDGFHEQVYVYGEAGLEVSDILSTFFQEAGSIRLMNTLDAMSVDTEEKTYGFRLESAFPAVLLSLNLQSQADTPQS